MPGEGAVIEREREKEARAIALLVPDRQNEISPGGVSRGGGSSSSRDK